MNWQATLALMLAGHLAAIAVNTLIHAVVDDLKANRMKINLITDQLLHFAQILVTFAVLN